MEVPQKLVSLQVLEKKKPNLFLCLFTQVSHMLSSGSTIPSSTAEHIFHSQSNDILFEMYRYFFYPDVSLAQILS